MAVILGIVGANAQTYVNVYGEFNGWQDNGLIPDANGITKHENLQIGNKRFKVKVWDGQDHNHSTGGAIAQGEWVDVNSFNDTPMTIAGASEGDIFDVEWNNNTKQIRLTKKNVELTYTYCLHGSIFTGFTGSWADIEMTETEGIWSVTADFIVGEFGAKKMANGEQKQWLAWSNLNENLRDNCERAGDGENPNVKLNADGNYTISIDPATDQISVKRNEQIVDENLYWTLHGSFNGAWKDFPLTKGADGLWSTTIENAKPCEFGIKSHTDPNNSNTGKIWYAGTATTHNITENGTYSFTSENPANFACDLAGTLNVSVDPATHKITISEATHASVLYLVGAKVQGHEDADSWWNSSEPVKIVLKNGIYSFKAKGDFKISTTKGSWDEFNAGNLNADGDWAVANHSKSLNLKTVGENKNINVGDDKWHTFYVTEDLSRIYTEWIDENGAVQYELFGTIFDGSTEKSVALTLNEGRFEAKGVDVVPGHFVVRKMVEGSVAATWSYGNAGRSVSHVTTRGNYTAKVGDESVSTLDGNYDFYFTAETAMLSIVGGEYVTVDENVPMVIYFYKNGDDACEHSAAWDKVYCYAWDINVDSKYNKNFPGVEMTPVEGEEGLYSITLTHQYDGIIFSNGNSDQDHWEQQSHEFANPCHNYIYSHCAYVGIKQEFVHDEDITPATMKKVTDTIEINEDDHSILGTKDVSDDYEQYFFYIHLTVAPDHTVRVRWQPKGGPNNAPMREEGEEPTLVGGGHLPTSRDVAVLNDSHTGQAGVVGIPVGEGTLILQDSKTVDGVVYQDPERSYSFNVEGVHTTGVETIVVEGAEAVYYNLQGVRVANPTSGTYIRVCGTEAVKVRL